MGDRNADCDAKEYNLAGSQMAGNGLEVSEMRNDSGGFKTARNGLGGFQPAQE